MKAILRVISGTLLIVLFYACKKETIEPDVTPELSVNRSALLLGAFAGYSDSFEVESSTGWELELSPANAAQWMEVSATEGNAGKTVVKVSNIATNPATQTATITIRPVGLDTPSVEVAITQKIYSLDWKKYTGGSSLGSGTPLSMVRTPDGGYAIAGFFPNGDHDAMVIKIDAMGNVQWNKPFGGNGDDILNSIALSPDGGYMVSGRTTTNQNGDVGVNRGQADAWVVKLNANGDKVWSKNFGGTGWDNPNSIVAIPGGGYALAGYTETNNNGDVGPIKGLYDVWLFKMDESGNLLWSKTFGGSGYDQAYSVVSAEGGGFVVASTTTSNNSGDVGTRYGSVDAWVLKLDATGNILWNKLFGGSKADELVQIVPTPDNGFILAGNTDSYNSGDVGETVDYDGWVLKIDAAGNKKWSKTYGGNDGDHFFAVAVTPEGDVLATGLSYSTDMGVKGENKGYSDLWVVRLNSIGTMLWSKTLGGDYIEGGDAILYSGNGEFMVAGNTFTDGNGDVDPGRAGDIWLLKFK
jgi:hypothetical protein